LESLHDRRDYFFHFDESGARFQPVYSRRRRRRRRRHRVARTSECESTYTATFLAVITRELQTTARYDRGDFVPASHDLNVDAYSFERHFIEHGAAYAIIRRR